MAHPDPEIQRAAGLIPAGTFVISSTFAEVRTGVIARSAQICSDEPTLVCVAIAKGHMLDPMIRDSRVFALCRVDPSDRLVRQNFAHAAEAEPEDRYDPFDSLDAEALETGAPLIKRAYMGLDCEVVAHFDLEAEHELFVGRVLAARVYREPE